MYYAYMLRCADGSLYAGYTDDPARRLAVHNSGKGAKYTRSRLPVTMVYCEEFQEKGQAMHREAEIKKMTRAEKIKLIDAVTQ